MTKNGKKKLQRRLRMATMSCHQTLKKMSHKDRVAQWQSTPDCVDPRGALVVRPMSE